MVTRDTHGIAIKATATGKYEDGKVVVQPIFKDPKTDKSGKKSAKGLLNLVKVDGDYTLTEEYECICATGAVLTPYEQISLPPNGMQPRFQNGMIMDKPEWNIIVETAKAERAKIDVQAFIDKYLGVVHSLK